MCSTCWGRAVTSLVSARNSLTIPSSLSWGKTRRCTTFYFTALHTIQCIQCIYTVYCTVLYIALYCSTLFFTSMHSELYCITLSFTMLCCDILHCIAAPSHPLLLAGHSPHPSKPPLLHPGPVLPADDGQESRYTLHRSRQVKM